MQEINQEEDLNPMVLRLGSPNPTPTDQESPIMLTDSCSIDPTSMKEASSTYDEGSPSFFPQISNPSTPQTSSLPSTTTTSTEQIEEGNIKKNMGKKSSMQEALQEIYHPTHSPTTDQESLFNGSKKRRCVTSSSDKRKKTKTSPFSSPKSPENAASTPNQKSNPSNASYFGRSSSFSSCFDSVQKSDDQKPTGDCSSGNCKVGVSAATTDHPRNKSLNQGSSSSPSFHLSPTDDSVQKPIGDHQKQIDELWEKFYQLFPKKKKQAGLNDLGFDLIEKISSFLPRAEARLWALLKNLQRVGIFAANPMQIDARLIRSWEPFWLNIDYPRLERNQTFNLLREREKDSYLILFVKELFKERRLYGLHLNGNHRVTRSLFTHRLKGLKTLNLCNVSLPPEFFDICGVVEELELDRCQVPSNFELKLGEEARLKLLSMYMCVEQDTHSKHIFWTILNVPTLLTFKYNGWVSFFDLGGARNLVHADIHFVNEASVPWCSKNLIYELLMNLRNVHTIRLCEHCIKNVEQRRSQLIGCLENPFPKLTDLFINVSSNEEKEVSELACLLMSVPVLARLHVTIGQIWVTPQGFWKSIESPIKFHNLLNFKIEPFKGLIAEIEFLEHILMNAPMLNKAEVVLEYYVQCSSMGERDQDRLMRALEAAIKLKEKILALPRASKTAEVIVEL